MVAVQNVNLKVSPGTTLGVLGANGSGKTTVLHMITGLLAATAGSVHYCGVSVSDKRSRSFYGLAPDDLPLPTALTGREYLQMVARLRDVADASIAECNLIEAFDLGSHLESLVGTYSTG